MVFKKLTNRILSAGTTAANTLLHGSSDHQHQAEKIRQLEAMGFPTERARHALNATDGDVDRAAELLLLGANEPQQQQQQQQTHTNNGGALPLRLPVAAARNNGHQTTNNNSNDNHQQQGGHVAAHNDEQMRRAIEESMQINHEEEARQLRQAEMASMHNNGTRDVIDLTDDNETTQHVAKAKSAPRKAPAAKQPPKKPPPAKNNNLKSAAAVNAGKAAATRNNNNNNNNNNRFFATNKKKKTLNQTHPNVRLPEKLSNKTKEEQILRCANRVKPHVMAVDTLLRVLAAVRASPDNPKFRTIDRSNGNYVKFVRDKPGAEDLLLAMNYTRILSCNNELRLERHMVDDALLYLGVSALEQMRLSEDYLENKRLRGFHAEMRRVAEGNGERMQSTGMTEAATAIRLAFLQKCPKEPPEGRGAIVTVRLGDESETRIEGGAVSRRFDGDDTLEDVLHWLGGCYGDEVLDKLRGAERVWCMCDLNRYPLLPLDVEKHRRKTLQYLGLFPSGKLGVRLSDDGWRDRKEGALGGGGGLADVAGSARGLGAASRSMLH